MNEQHDTAIRVRFCNSESIPAGLFISILRNIEEELFFIELEELEAIIKELSDIPSEIADACRQRIKKYLGHNLLIKSAHTGSIIIDGFVAATAFWIVKNTIGHSFLEAYKRSDLNIKLQKFFLTRMSSKSKEVEDKLQKKLYRPPMQDTAIHITVKQKGNIIEIKVEIIKKDDIPPKPSQLFTNDED